MSGNTVSVQAAIVKSQSTTVANKSTVKKNRWTRLIQKYEKSEKINQLIFVKYKGNSKADIILYKKANGKFKKVFACAGYVGKNGINKSVKVIRKHRLVPMVSQKRLESKVIREVR